jgi:hypothetical protein
MSININEFELYKSIKEQNDTLAQNLENKNQEFATDNQLFIYGGNYYEHLTFVNFILLVLYYILLIGVAVLLFASPKVTFSMYIKIAILIIAGIFPFVFMWIEKGAWKVIRYVWSVLNGVVLPPQSQ